MDRKGFSLLFISLSIATALVACRNDQAPEAPVMSASSIRADLAGDVCPSMEGRAGMQLAWTQTG